MVDFRLGLVIVVLGILCKFPLVFRQFDQMPPDDTLKNTS